MIGVLRSEWLKVRSVGSTWNTLAVIAALVLLMAFMAWQGVQGWDDLSVERRARFQAPPMELVVLPFLQLCVAVLGILAITSEYATGMIHTSIAAVPRRLKLLMSKAGVIAIIALVVGLVVPVATHFISRMIVGDRPTFPGYAAPAPYETPMLLGLSLSVIVAALVGLGLGAALRAATGALMAVTVLLLMLPTLARVLPEPWNVRVASITLLNLPGQLSDRIPADGVLSPLGALIVMAAYVVAALGAAAFVITRRDA